MLRQTMPSLTVLCVSEANVVSDSSNAGRSPAPEVLRPHPPSVQGPDGLVWAGQRWPEAEILILRIHNRKRFGSTETSSVQPKPLRFNRNRFG